jgi:hypothetical protein
MPTRANATNIAKPAIANCALLGGWDCGGAMNMDATDNTATRSTRVLPRIATMALAVTPTGLLMQIIYFFYREEVDSHPIKARSPQDDRWFD